MDTNHFGGIGNLDLRDDREVQGWAEHRDDRAAPAKQYNTKAVYASAWYHDAAIEADRQAAIDARCNPYHH